MDMSPGDRRPGRGRTGGLGNPGNHGKECCTLGKEVGISDFSKHGKDVALHVAYF